MHIKVYVYVFRMKWNRYELNGGLLFGLILLVFALLRWENIRIYHFLSFSWENFNFLRKICGIRELLVDLEVFSTISRFKLCRGALKTLQELRIL